MNNSTHNGHEYVSHVQVSEANVGTVRPQHTKNELFLRRTHSKDSLQESISGVGGSP